MIREIQAGDILVENRPELQQKWFYVVIRNTPFEGDNLVDKVLNIYLSDKINNGDLMAGNFTHEPRVAKE